MPSKNDYLFVSLGGSTPGTNITPRGLRIILKRIGEKVGVENVHPVQRLGRWKNLATFERYTQVLMIDDDFARDEAASYSLLKDIRSRQ